MSDKTITQKLMENEISTRDNIIEQLKKEKATLECYLGHKYECKTLHAIHCNLDDVPKCTCKKDNT